MARGKAAVRPKWKYPNNILFKNIPPEQDARLVEIYRKEPILFMEQFLWVRHKEKGLMRLKLNADQLLVYHVFQGMRAKGMPIRVIILKARQIGVSTFVEAWIYTMCRLIPGTQAFILAHQDKTASKIFEFFEGFNDHLPIELQPKKRRRTTAKFVFDGMDSAIETATAGKTNPTDPSRGYALNLVHATEIPWYADAEKTLKGILSGTSKGPESMVALESTPEGTENHYYDLWELAVEKMPQVNDDGSQINWYPIFLPWWLHEEYELELSPADIANDTFAWAKLTEREREIVTQNMPHLPGSTLETWLRKLKWRRREVAIGCGYSERTFEQEFPSDPKSCFLASGETIYCMNSIEFFIRNTMKEPIAKGCIRRNERGKPYFVEQPDSSNEYPLLIWEWPRPNMRYVLGADAALGSRQKDQRTQRAKEQQGEGGGDYSAACVLSKDRVQVAEYRKQVIDPMDFAEVIATIGEFYNKAILNPEVNNGGGNAAGYAVLLRLKECYPTALIAPWPHWDHKNRVSNSSALGFEANTKGGQIILAAGQRELRRGAGELKAEDGEVGVVDKYWPKMIIRSKDLLSELASYKLRNDGSAGAQKGKHDDLVRAWGTAVLALSCLGPPRSQQNQEELRSLIESLPYNRHGRPHALGQGSANAWMLT